MFHTGSVAEFHEPWLRYLLYQYVKKLDHPSITEEEVKNSLTDDKEIYVVRTESRVHILGGIIVRTLL